MGQSDVIPFGIHSRESAAVHIAGTLAECGVQRLTISDPRACRTRELLARESNLPGELLSLPAGATLSGGGVALLIDDSVIRWVADAPIATALRAITR